jgi:hypothetical protein
VISQNPVAPSEARTNAASVSNSSLAVPGGGSASVTSENERSSRSEAESIVTERGRS